MCNKNYESRHTLNNISSNSNCFCDPLHDVLREWKCWVVVIHINQVHYQLYAYKAAAAIQYYLVTKRLTKTKKTV